jgi:ABC-type dipeptide/oligopeptide/nickel transport system permease subunit
MNALLYFPGIIIVIILAAGLERAIRTIVLITEVQVFLHLVLLTIGPPGRSIHASTCS